MQCVCLGYENKGAICEDAEPIFAND